jgi:hypothetical protein
MTVFMSGCRNNTCTHVDQRIMSSNFNNGESYMVQIDTLLDIKWTQMLVISGPRFPDEIEEISGVGYTQMIPDDKKLYLFLEGEKIVEHEISSCNGLNWIYNSEGYLSVEPEDLIMIKVRKTEGVANYQISK